MGYVSLLNRGEVRMCAIYAYVPILRGREGLAPTGQCFVPGTKT